MLARSFPRRQQYRRLRRAATSGAASLAACALAITAAASGTWAVAGAVLLAAVALGSYARRWQRLAARSRIGARSENEVRHALAVLGAEGWQLRHSLAYGGSGDIDSVAIAPTGIAFTIVFCPHLARRWCPPLCDFCSGE